MRYWLQGNTDIETVFVHHVLIRTKSIMVFNFFFFMLPRLEVGFLIYVKIELLNILKGFLKIA